MNIRTCLRPPIFAFGTLWFCLALSAQAATISVTYAISATGSGDPTNPPLFGNGTGSLVPLGSMTWRDMSFPDLATGANVGTFTMTFANGDTLVGALHEQLDLSSPPTAAAFTQTLDVTGGTGSFFWYNGTLTGSGTANLVAGPFSVSGSGTLNTTPEPGSLALLPLGLLSLVAYRNRALGSRSVDRQTGH
ncbi:MAG TPA: PEP-CTERM sorting domain-containing protein [Bryobacteraceae bacterium]|nr:PEP-CTERM sorting domain-containing protein [Bryobacteraceae bacterium]